MSKVTVLLPADTSLKKECDTICSEIKILSANKKYSTDIETILVSISDTASISKILCSNNPMVVYGDDLANKIEEMVGYGNVINRSELGGSVISNGCKPCLMVAAGDLKNLAKNPFFKNHLFYRFCYSGDRYAKWLSLTNVVVNLKTDRIGFLAIKGDAFAGSMFDDLDRYLRRQKKTLCLKEITPDASIDVKNLSDEFKALYISGFGDNLKSLFYRIQGYKGVVFTDSAFAVTFNEYGFSPDYEVFVLMPTAIKRQQFKDYFAYFVYAAVLYLLENEGDGAYGVNQMTRMISTEGKVVENRSVHRLGDVLIQDGGDLIFEQSLFNWKPQQKKFVPTEGVGLGNVSAEIPLKAHGLAAQMQGIDNIIDGINVKISRRELSELKSIAKKIAGQIEVSFGSDCLSLYLNNENINAEEKLLYVTERPIWRWLSENPCKIREFLGSLKGLKLKDPIQISMLKDSEDNNTYQFYIAQETKEKNSVHEIYPLSEYISLFFSEYSSLFCGGKISAIIIAKTEEMARIIHSKHFGGISEESIGWVRYYGGWMRNCDNSHAQSVIYGFRLLYNHFGNSDDSARRYCYLIPDIALTDNQNDSNSFAVIATRDKLSYLKLRLLVNGVTRFFSVVNGSIHSQLLKIANTKSAIGSIMSRNGSHNIGSHVLAALSHNVGTMPDDRVLYQYIQHRMDYIATVTTDFPTWTQPTMLLGALMKGFLSQRHLLDYIAESEGLSAWQFQGCKLSDEERKKQHWIEFHVRRKTRDGSYEELIEYPTGAVHLDKDVSLAIPGGAVGYHAFYTILENVLRNAAKHDWSVKNNGKDDSERGDLPIYIDFEEKQDYVEIEIWARLSKLPSGEELPQKLQGLIERSFINDNGQLRRENWGLAEMKISAGYLRRSGIDVIGDLKHDGRKLENENALILATAVRKTVSVGENNVNEPGTYLAYRFSIPKPRELLIIVNAGVGIGEEQKARIKEAEKFGAYVRNWSEILSDGKTNARALELNYRFVVHPKVTKDVLTTSGVKFPFRVLSGEKANSVNGMVPQFTKYNDAVTELLSSSRDVKQTVENVLKAVYECWCEHIVDTYRKDIKPRNEKSKKAEGKHAKCAKIGLLIAPSEASHTGGHSLISDADILKYVMRECFEDCVKQYKVLCGDLPGSERIKLDEFSNLCKSAREIDSVTLDKNKDNPQDNIARFLHKWVSSAISPSLSDSKRMTLLSSIKKEIENGYHVEEESTTDNSDDLPPDMASVVEIGTSNIEEGNRGAAVREVKRMLNKGSIDGFIEYIASVLEQVKSLFKQYEENIVSLPNGYRVDTRTTVGEGDNSGNSVELGGFAKVVFDVNHANAGSWIAYRRHDNSLTKEIIFAEPLSGTQSYLTQIARLAENLKKSRGGIITAEDFGLCMRLLENGLMRILVIDERVAKFVREHKTEVESTYNSMGISVLDDKLKTDTGVDCETVNVLDEFKKMRCNKSLSGKFEILIIHQGVLDKWFPNDKNDKTKMGKILDGFKEMVKYVVITTGRGTPSNIPEDAHLIPFAVVEAALFRKYPEKLILVDAVMNVLAIGRYENEGG